MMMMMMMMIIVVIIIRMDTWSAGPADWPCVQ